MKVKKLIKLLSKVDNNKIIHILAVGACDYGIITYIQEGEKIYLGAGKVPKFNKQFANIYCKQKKKKPTDFDEIHRDHPDPAVRTPVVDDVLCKECINKDNKDKCFKLLYPSAPFHEGYCPCRVEA